MSDELKEAFDQRVKAIEEEWTAMLPITNMILDAWRKINEQAMRDGRV